MGNNLKNQRYKNMGIRPEMLMYPFQAESVAYIVCQYYGLDTSDYSFGYVAGWSSGKDLKELKASLETIRATAHDLITTIDGHLVELQKKIRFRLRARITHCIIQEQEKKRKQKSR